MKTEARFPVLTPESVSADEFVAFWARFYKYPDERAYTDNIGQCDEDALVALFRWKAGARFASKADAYLKRAVLPRLDELRDLPDRTTASEFLDLFIDGGAIWRIFLLHCWRPDRFAIFDQHVWRAYAMIRHGAPEELEGRTDLQKIALYVDQYLPWWSELEGDHDAVDRDRALWVFGKVCKSTTGAPFDVSVVVTSP